jgi:hypothetical protein
MLVTLAISHLLMPSALTLQDYRYTRVSLAIRLVNKNMSLGIKYLVRQTDFSQLYFFIS